MGVLTTVNTIESIDMPTRRHPKKEVHDAIETVLADPWWRFEKAGTGVSSVRSPPARWMPDRDQCNASERWFARSPHHPREPEVPAPTQGGANEMNEFSFTLILDASGLSDSQISALYETVPDSTASERNERAYVGLDREAPDFATAVVSAIEDVERALPHVRVLALEPEDLVSQSDIAQRRGRSRESVSQLVKGERGPGDFPQPRYFVADRGLWRWRDVEKWFDAYEGRQPQTHHETFIDAVNAVLAVRRSQPALESKELSALRRLAKDTELVELTADISTS